MANTQHEPTMEEILASIRKIIAEDPPAEGAAASMSESEEPEVLDLTQEVHEEKEAVASESKVDQPDHLSATSADTAPGVGAPPAHEGFFSEKTRKALTDAFVRLEPQPTTTGDEEMPSVGGLPIEAAFEKAVRETFDPVLRKWLDDNTEALIDRMKPVISEWLDNHFAPMLEDAVRNEVARAVLARGRR